MKSLSRVRLFATPWTVAHQAPLSMGFSRQEYWSGMPFPSPGDLPDPGSEPGSPTWQALTSEPQGKPQKGPEELIRLRDQSFEMRLREKKVEVAQSLRLTVCVPMDYTVHGFLQARILEWVAICFFRGSSQPRDRTRVSHMQADSLLLAEPSEKP